MLFTELLKKHEATVKPAVAELFENASNNQSDENDLLLALIHGHYDESATKFKSKRGKRFSPYVFGIGSSGMPHRSQYDFFHWYRSSYTVEGSRDKYYAYVKTLKNWRDSIHLNIQIELMVYMKFWESYYVLKQLYNVCKRLLHGKHYDWHKEIKYSKKNLIEEEIIGSTKKESPKFYDLISKIYIRQIRNAAAHSQFYLSGDYLNFSNYDPKDGHNLNSLTLDEWEELFHQFIVFYNELIFNVSEYEKRYMEEAKDKEFGRHIRIIKKDGSEQYEWLKCLPEIPRWVWYKSWKQS